MVEIRPARRRRPPATTPRPGDVAGAVRALVGEYERIGDANVRWAAVGAARRASPSCSTRRGRATRRGSRPCSTTACRRRRRPAAGPSTPLHAATDVYTWKLLRRDLHLSRAETEKIIVDLVVGVLEGAPDHDHVPTDRAATSSPSSTAAAPCRPSSGPFAASSSAATTSPSSPRTPSSRTCGHRGRRSARGSQAPNRPTPPPRATTPTGTGSARTRSQLFARLLDTPVRRPGARLRRRRRPRRSPTHRPDLVVCSFFAFGAMVAAEAAGIPFDVLMPNIYLLPARGMPPLGLGLKPAAGPLGRGRDRARDRARHTPVEQGTARAQRPASVPRPRARSTRSSSRSTGPTGSWC